jgi:hypothetical protein
LTTVMLATAGAGLWLGIGVAVIHYRFRRPLLDLSRAVSVVDPRRVVILSPARPFPFASRSLWRDDHEAHVSIRRLGGDHRPGAVPEIRALGASGRTERRLGRRMRRILNVERHVTDAEPSWTVFVCTPATGEFDLALARRLTQRAQEGVDLIWVR